MLFALSFCFIIKTVEKFEFFFLDKFPLFCFIVFFFFELRSRIISASYLDIKIQISELQMSIFLINNPSVPLNKSLLGNCYRDF